MKKLLLMAVVVLFGLVLTACDNLGEKDKKLRDALKLLAETDNYQINITLNDDLETYNIVLQFDGDISYFRMNEVEEYYEKKSNRIVTYRVVDEKVTVIREDKGDDKPYKFLDSMTYDLFEYVENGDYYLLENGKDELPKEFVKTIFDDAAIANFKVTVNQTDGFIKEVMFDIGHNSEFFSVKMTYSEYGNIDLALPSV